MNTSIYIGTVSQVQGLRESLSKEIIISIHEAIMRYSYLDYDYAMSSIAHGELLITPKELPKIQLFPEKKHFKKINTAPAQKNRYVNFLCIKENILLFLISRFNTSAYNDERLAIHG